MGGKDETVVTDHSSVCGECYGCQVEYDCLRCTGCKNRLLGKDNSACQERMCKWKKRYQYVDSLGNLSCQNKAEAEDEDLISIGLASMAKEEEASILSKQNRRPNYFKIWRRRQQAAAASQSSVVSKEKAPKKRRKGQKNPLHDLDSYLEGRAAVRAFMKYDEADQDWL